MSLYEDVSRYVHPSIMTLLFGDRGDRYSPLRRKIALPRVSHDICVFYCAIVQSRAINHCKNCSKSVMEFFDNKAFPRAIMDLWHGKGIDLHSESVAVSFLKGASRAMPEADILFGENIINALNSVAEDYNQVKKNDRSVPLTKSIGDLLELLKNLPLLLDLECRKGVLTHSVIGEIHSEPFFFIEEGKIFVTTSARKGLCNSQLILARRELNSPGEVEDYDKFYVNDSEYMSIFCNVLDLDVRWYDQKQYLGNCMYVVNLSDVLSHCIIEGINKKHADEGTGMVPNILPEVKYYFRYSEISKDLMEMEKEGVVLDSFCTVKYPDREPVQNGLSNIMMGFIIKYGAFVALHDFFFDGSSKLLREHVDFDDNYGEIDVKWLFREVAVKYIKKMKYTLVDDPERVVKYYVDIIHRHLDELSTIINKDDNAYKIRADYIKAEQRTCCIIDLMGMQQSNIFIDQERMLSSQDYVDKVFNQNTTPQSLMHDLTDFLIRFYSRITNVTKEVPEMEHLWQYVQLFRDYCEETKGNKGLEANIGRDIVSDIGIMDRYVKLFQDNVTWEFDGISRFSKGNYFFISYSHADTAIVKGLVNQIVAAGFSVVHDGLKGDGSDFDVGSSWVMKAQERIRDERCIGMILFVSDDSVCSPAVLKEVRNAMKHADELIAKGKLNRNSASEFMPVVVLNGKDNFEWLDTTKVEDCERFGTNAVTAYNTMQEFSDYLHNANIFTTPSTMDMLFKKLDKLTKENYIHDMDIINIEDINTAERYILSYLAFLKSGRYTLFGLDDGDREAINCLDKGLDVGGKPFGVYQCVYPLLISVKETRVKRDKVTILNYDIYNGKKNSCSTDKIMLTSDNIAADDYYCIPNVHSSHECGEWISNPVLILAREMRL